MSRLFIDHCQYFVTVPTLDHEPIFDQVERRRLLLRRLKTGFERFGLTTFHYSLMSDHYHFVLQVTDGSVIPTLLQYINGGTSFDLKLKRRQSIWSEYHVYVPTTEDILERVIGYVVGNPMKHGEVQSLNELAHWEFSSYSTLVEDVGSEMAGAMVRSSVVLEDKDFSMAEHTTGLKSLGNGLDGTKVPGKIS